MTESVQAQLNKYIDQVKKIYGIHLKQIILYGIGVEANVRTFEA